MTAPTLVILAAGLGSRYGDAKQVAGVGPDGEWLLEYAIRDALAAGFASIVMVIREALRDQLQDRLAARLAGRAALHFVVQSTTHVPAGCQAPVTRSKPLGTGHAVWSCAPLLHGPFAVINADDYYGPHAFALLAAHFATRTTPAMVGYRLTATLSAAGGVNRGVCAIDATGHLASVTEYLNIAERGGALTGATADGAPATLSPDTTVSLNCWGLWPDLLLDLETGLRAFLPSAGDKNEYFLPHAISAYLAHHTTQLAVLPTPDTWLGLTYPADHAHAVAAIAALHRNGTYPTPLWPTA
ncbi:MAG TPA: NTP transferase domain-containing protein [Rhodanobacteraceae bacterium]